MVWQLPKTNWTPDDGVTEADCNRIEGNTLQLKEDAAAHLIAPDPHTQYALDSDLVAKLHQTTGHDHDGTAGNGPKIPISSLAEPIVVTQAALDSLAGVGRTTENVKANYDMIVAAKEDIKELDYNIYNLILENYYSGKITPKQGLQFDGFSDTTKIDTSRTCLTVAAVNGAVSLTVKTPGNIAIGESILVSSVNGTTETKITNIVGDVYTVSPAIGQNHPVGALVARTNATIDTGGKQAKFATYALPIIQASIGPTDSYVGYDNTEFALGQSIYIPFDMAIDALLFYAAKNGTPGDNITCSIYSAAGVAGVLLGTSTPVAGNGWTLDIAERTFVFPTPVVIAGGTTIYAKFYRSGANSMVNGYRFATTQTDVYSGGTAYRVNSANTWTVINNADLTFSVSMMAPSTTKAICTQNKIVYLSAIDNARLWLTRTNIAGTTVVPKISVVTSGAVENLQVMTLISSIDNGDGTFEDTYSWTGTAGVDVVVSIAITKDSDAKVPYCKKYGMAVGV